MYLSQGLLEGGVFPHPPNTVYPTLTTAPFSLLLNSSYPIPMAYYDNISDAGIHFTSSVPEGLEAYRFPCQTSTTENASDADVCPASSVPDELEAYTFLGHMPGTENVSDAEVYPTSSMPGGLEAYPFSGHILATENVSGASIYPTSSVPGELETHPFLGQMSATENINDEVYPTSSVPGEFEAYPFLGQMSATEEVDFLAGYTLADPWSMAEQPNSLASSTTGFGATASYGTYHCHRSSHRLVSDAWTSRASGFHLVRHRYRWLR